MKILSAVLALAVSLAIVGNLSAEEKKKGQRSDRPMMGMMHMFEGVDLSEEQKANFKELWKGYMPKLKAVGEKMGDILTEEQKTARAEARKAAIEAGKKGKEIRDAVQDAVKLTDEQKAKFAELRKERQALRKELREKSMEIMTPEQKEILKKTGQRPDRPMMGGMRMFEGVDLSEEQKTNLKELRKGYMPKLKAVGEKLGDIMTEAQKTVRAEARKIAIEAGKKGKEIRDAVQDAVKLTDEQKAMFAELRKEMQSLRKELREKSMEILTPEQKEVLKAKYMRWQKHKAEGK